MAVTHLRAMHIDKGQSLAQCLRDRLDYGKNPDKTDDGKFISSYECDPDMAATEFLFSKMQYENITGRHHKNDRIAYQIMQSFKPGEITPEEANKIGYELAMRWTKGKYAFVVCTHVDKKHIHNHIYYNSTALDCEHKWFDFPFSRVALRRLSDILCLENGLSIITPKPYNERTKRTDYQHKETERDKIRAAIDVALEKKPKSFDELIRLLEKQGYQYKPGKQPGLIGNSQKRVARFRSLGEGYTVEDLMAAISGNKEFSPPQKKPGEKSAQSHITPRMQFLIDIQAKIQEGKGGGYVSWAKTFNLKQKAAALMFISEHNISSAEELKKLASEQSQRLEDLRVSIKKDEARLPEIAALKTHIINYAKSKEVFAQYKASGYSADFFEEHREILTLRRAASKAFREYEKQHPTEDGSRVKLPTLKELSAEYSQILERKKKSYSEYHAIRDEARNYIVTQKIIEEMFGDEAKRESMQQHDVQNRS